ncbi:MAG: ribonuclease III [Lachnospiraceae bacterium]|nr:ribonuclease III [Lachnospiraceae bacterium]
MKETYQLNEQIAKTLELPEKDIRSYSPLTLAFVGDAFYELVIRTMVTEEGNKSVDALNRKKTKFVRAAAQSAMMHSIEALLTEEEEAVYHRGRNAHPKTTAKGASVTEYRHATGFEALIGYLYLTGETGRALDLIREALSRFKPDAPVQRA